MTKPFNPASHNQSSVARSRRARASSQSRACPACGRGGALTRHTDFVWRITIHRCRFCGWEGDTHELHAARRRIREEARA